MANATPVLFVPGLPGSHLHDLRREGKKVFFSIPAILFRREETFERLEGPDDLTLVHDSATASLRPKDDVVAGQPIGSVVDFGIIDLGKQYKSLYDILRRLGPKPMEDWFRPVGWDWRRPVYDEIVQDTIEREIHSLFEAHGRKVVVLVHSTGGLVLRHLLKDKPELGSRIGHVVAFGVPWAGTLKSLQFLAGQSGFGGGLVGAEKAQQIFARSWAAYDLLPPDPDLTEQNEAPQTLPNLVVDNRLRPTSPLIERDWFHPDLTDDMTERADAAQDRVQRLGPSLVGAVQDLPVTNVVGWGVETLLKATIRGRQVELEPGTDGDGTVPRRSASWLRGPRIHTFHVPIGRYPRTGPQKHASLWRNPGGRNLLGAIVGGRPLEPFAYGAVDWSDALDPASETVLVRFVALDDEGRPLPQARVRVRDLQPDDPTERRFEPDTEGRLELTLPRDHLRRVDNNFRRFTAEIRWEDGAGAQVVRRSFLVAR